MKRNNKEIVTGNMVYKTYNGILERQTTLLEWLNKPINENIRK